MTHEAVETDPVVALTPATFDDAQRRVAPVVHRTPVLSSASLSREPGSDVLLKAELLQRTGSYKIRGPSNKLPQLTARAAGARRDLLVGRKPRPGRGARGRVRSTRLWRWRRTRRRRRSPRPKPTAPRSSCTGASGTRRTPRRSELADRARSHDDPPFRRPASRSQARGRSASRSSRTVPEVDVVVVPIGGGGLSPGSRRRSGREARSARDRRRVVRRARR